MASVWNALRNISSDSWWAVKLLVLSTPVYFIVDGTYLSALTEDEKLVVYIVLGAFYLGFAGVLMHRNINNKTPLMPSLFGIPELIAKSICMSLVSMPLFILYYACINAINTHVVFEPFIMWVIYICVTLFFSPFLFIPAVLYSVNGKISDAFNFKCLIEGGGNFSVQILSFAIQYFFTIFFVSYLFYQLFINMVNDTTALNIIISIAGVLSFLTFYSFCSDMYNEQIPPLPEKKKKKKSKTVDS